jgi:hypothetical protein
VLFVVPFCALALLDLDVVERSFVRDFLSLVVAFAGRCHLSLSDFTAWFFIPHVPSFGSYCDFWLSCSSS